MAKIYSIILGFLLLGGTPVFVQAAANLSFSAASNSVAVNERLVVSVMVSSTQSLNAVSGDILIPPGSFVIDTVSKSGSVLNFWVTEPTFSSATGVVHFEGVTLGGFQGTGKILSITIHPKQAGTGSVSFKSAQVLANDGQGTTITGNLGTKSFTINEKAPTTPSKIIPTKTQSKEVIIPEIVEPIEKSQVPATLNAPEIMLGAKYGEPAIIGTSQYPKAQLLVTFVDDQGSKVFITSDAAEDGSFVVLVPRALRGGSYTVTALAVKSDGTHSLVSHEIRVQVGGWFNTIDWRILAGGISLLALFFLFIIYRIVSRDTVKPSGTIKREVHVAEHTIHESFDSLREDISDYAHGKTAPERKKITEIKKEIDQAEDVISKQVEDIT